MNLTKIAQYATCKDWTPQVERKEEEEVDYGSSAGLDRFLISLHPFSSTTLILINLIHCHLYSKMMDNLDIDHVYCSTNRKVSIIPAGNGPIHNPVW